MADYVDMFNKNFGVNFSVCSIRSACSAYHVEKTKKRVIWTEDMDKYLIENYPGFTKSVDDFLVLFNNKGSTKYSAPESQQVASFRFHF